MIDPHVHLRDWREAESETLAHGFSVAWRVGLSAVFEMPNTVPPLATRAMIRRRLDDADAALALTGVPLFHAVYALLTSDSDQIREVVRAHGDLFPRVIGLKFFAGSSTGNLGVTDVSDQFSVWRTLAREGFQGVVAVHAEREDLFRTDAWNPQRPSSHSDVRPPLSELASVQTQLALAEAAGFRGHLHFCHVTTAGTVALVRAERDGLPFTVSVAVTPHHALLHSGMADELSGAWLRVNPPLRDESDRDELFAALIRGEVDWIESDHAPHTLDHKRAGSAGLPGLGGYRLLVEALAEEQVLSPSAIDGLTADNVCAAFGIDPCDLPENPFSPLSPGGGLREELPQVNWRSVASEYSFDPYNALTQSPDFPLPGPSAMLTRNHD